MKYSTYITNFSILSAFTFSVSSCGRITQTIDQDVGKDGQNSGIVVRARAIIPLSNEPFTSSTQQSARALSVTQPTTVSNSANSSMSLDNTLFLNPAISNTIISFGFLQISNLFDNDLKVCGNNGNQKCNTALIRTYTTDTDKAGFYNASDDFGAPITAGQSSLSSVGLNAAGALTLQSISIPNNKHTIKLSDFANPKYNYQADFSDAGAGSYSTTIVIEYALTL